MIHYPEKYEVMFTTHSSVCLPIESLNIPLYFDDSFVC